MTPSLRNFAIPLRNFALQLIISFAELHRGTAEFRRGLIINYQRNLEFGIKY